MAASKILACTAVASHSDREREVTVEETASGAVRGGRSTRSAGYRAIGQFEISLQPATLKDLVEQFSCLIGGRGAEKCRIGDSFPWPDMALT